MHDRGWFSLELRRWRELTVVALWRHFLLLRQRRDHLLLDVGSGGSGAACSGTAVAGTKARVEVVKPIMEVTGATIYIRGLAHGMRHKDSEPGLSPIRVQSSFS
jgi:hypothetical protein